MTVRAEMSRLRRSLGGLLLARPYRIAPEVEVVVPSSRLPLPAARRHPASSGCSPRERAATSAASRCNRPGANRLRPASGTRQ